MYTCIQVQVYIYLPHPLQNIITILPPTWSVSSSPNISSPTDPPRLWYDSCSNTGTGTPNTLSSPPPRLPLSQMSMLPHHRNDCFQSVSLPPTRCSWWWTRTWHCHCHHPPVRTHVATCHRNSRPAFGLLYCVCSTACFLTRRKYTHTGSPSVTSM